MDEQSFDIHDMETMVARLQPVIAAAIRAAVDAATAPDPLMSAKDVAAYTGVHYKSIVEWGRTGGPDGTFPCSTPIPGTRHIRWRLSEIEAWLRGETPSRREHAA